MSDQDVLFNIEESTSSDQDIDIDQNASPAAIPDTNIDFIDLDELTEFPWRKPGTDITDYFNYGFDENSWRIYCKRQREGRWGKKRDYGRDEKDLDDFYRKEQDYRYSNQYDRR